MYDVQQIIARAQTQRDADARRALTGLSDPARLEALYAYQHNGSLFLLDVWAGRWPGLRGLDDRALLQACKSWV